MTDAEKLSAVRALLDNPPGRKHVGVDELLNILNEAEPYRPSPSQENP